MNTQTENPTPTTRRLRPHPACKIARLPLEVREMINQSIADNIPNTEIISRLETMGHHDINPMNLSRWTYSGYLVWLRHRERHELLRVQTEANCNLVRELEAADPTACSRVNNVYLAGQLAQLMDDFDLKSLKKILQSDPANYFRLVRSINAQTRNTFRHQRLQADLAKQQLLDQRDLGELPPTTSAAGYAAAAEYYGLPPRFSKDLPISASTNQNQDKNQPNIGS